MITTTSPNNSNNNNNVRIAIGNPFPVQEVQYKNTHPVRLKLSNLTQGNK